MHVLHRTHDLHRAAFAALAAVVLAIVLTLAIAGGLNDFGSTPTPASAPTQAVVHAAPVSSLSSDPFTQNPFTSPITAPVQLPFRSGT